MEYGDYGAGLYGIGLYDDGHWFLYSSRVGGVQRASPSLDVALARKRTPLHVDMNTNVPSLKLEIQTIEPVPNVAMIRTHDEFE